MNTRKVLLISSDKDLISIIKISALTLTKLNRQVSITETIDYNFAVEQSKAFNLDLVIIDLDEKKINVLKLLNEIRKNKYSKSKKIISVYSGEINRDKIFKAGCDSIMSKDEIKRVVNNILQY